MALSFNKQRGSAQKSEMNLYKYTDGDNSFRLVGDIIPRYLYWVANSAGQNLPFECLAFDRDAEAFNRLEKDWVQEFYPDLKCSWAYATQCIVEENGQPTLKVLPLKKKLWEQIVQAAEDLGDPTDPTEGWDVKFKRTKTGPHAYNVEYTLSTVKIMKDGARALSADELAIIKDLKSMDEVLPREAPDAQRDRLEKLQERPKTATSEEHEADMESEFDID